MANKKKNFGYFLAQLRLKKILHLFKKNKYKYFTPFLMLSNETMFILKAMKNKVSVAM